MTNASTPTTFQPIHRYEHCSFTIVGVTQASFRVVWQLLLGSWRQTHSRIIALITEKSFNERVALSALIRRSLFIWRSDFLLLVELMATINSNQYRFSFVFLFLLSFFFLIFYFFYLAFCSYSCSCSLFLLILLSAPLLSLLTNDEREAGF